MSSGHGHGGHGRRPKKHEEEEHENHERWAVSYADMMTVLVGLFIVLFAMSKVDEVKFEQLRQSLAIGFGNEAPSMLAGGSGALTGLSAFEITPSLKNDVGVPMDEAITPDVTVTPETDLTEEQKNYDLAITEYNRLTGIADTLAERLAAQGLDDRVRFSVTSRGLIVGMVADDVFFRPASAELTPTAYAILDAIGPVLRDLSEEISVEGNANTLPAGRNYETNWELAADRAVQVLRRLVEVDGLPGTRVAATSFGDQRPLADPEGDPLAANRRVDLVVLSPVPDAVKQYLPEVAAAAQKG
ncbi:flagellar motor protein MotB [Actinotalea sp.]|uniref:flagellar motor protein MotB n=1 Tax=Actinotalea sp. TaxID=1872145 RepID=UPI00356AB65B